MVTGEVRSVIDLSGAASGSAASALCRSDASENYPDGTKFSADRLRFVNLTVDEATSSGVSESACISESPFTDYVPTGLNYSPDVEVGVLVEILPYIERTASLEKIA